MTKINLTVLAICTLFISCGNKESTSNTEVGQVDHEQNVDLGDLIGKVYAFEYSEYTYHIKIESDSTVFWKLYKGESEGVTEDSDKFIYSKINNDVHFISWTEKSGLTLFNILDFQSNTLTTHAKLDGQMFINPGAIKLVE